MLSERQRRTLGAICEAFGPERPSAAELGVPAAIEEAVAAAPREADRKQFAQLLSAWDTHLVTAIGGGGMRRFSALPRASRERVLLSWGDSRVPQRRAAFQALKGAALALHYGLPGPQGRNPLWDSMEYPGALGDPPEVPKPIQPLEVTTDLDLHCDVVVVGSGAGGGTTAGVLAAAGLDVIVLEAGSYYNEADFDGGEASGYRRLYAGGGSMATADGSIGLLAGACLGGGTVVNYSTSFRTPDDVREEWAGHGVPAFAGDEYGRSLDAVWERLGVNSEYSTPLGRDAALKRGLDELGWHSDRMTRNVNGCDQGKVCGHCGFGCRLGAKMSTLKTWLQDAADRGARMIVDTAADRVTVEAGRATGVEATHRDPESGATHSVRVGARAVVAAAGAIQTPALLRRSGLGDPNIGRNLRLHPATAVWGVMEEEVRGWEGVMQAVYSNQHADLDEGYGLKYQTAPFHPMFVVGFFPWRSAAHHASLMEQLAHTAGIGILVRDRDGGEVRVGRDGQPVPHFRLSKRDLAHGRVGIEGAAQILEAAGAKRIFSSHTADVSYVPDGEAARAEFMRRADAAGYGPGRIAWNSFHITGSCRMGGSPKESAANPQGELHATRDLWICDASCFPTSSGVNPMISVEAIAHMNAQHVRDRLV